MFTASFGENNITMRIGFDAKRLYNNFTGLGNYSRTLVSNLMHFHPDEEYFLYTTRVSSDPVVARFLNNRSVVTRLPDIPFKSLWRTFSMSKQLFNDHINLYHGLSGEIPLGIVAGSTKSVVTVHDLIFLVHPETYKPVDRFFYDRKFRSACNRADAIVAISSSTRDDLVRYYGTDPSKIRIVYQACDPVFYSDADTQLMGSVSKEYKLPENFLLYVGSVIPRKNLAMVIKAIANLPGDLRIPLVVVGDGGSYKDEIRKLIAAEKLDRLVIWIENLHESSRLKALYNLASAFLYPSLYEGFGIPVAEALLSKVPVLTSSRSSLPEAAGPHSFLADPDDAEQISAGIEKILTDTELRETMITEGYRYATEKFSPEVTSEEIFRLYKQCLD